MVEELFSRAECGIYTAYRPGGQPDLIVTGPPQPQLGLILKIEHAVNAGLKPIQRLHKPDAAADRAWRERQYHLLTTCEILDRIRNRAGTWAFGLLLKDEKTGARRSAMLTHGDPIVLAGLLSNMRWSIAHHTLRWRLNQPGEPCQPEVALSELLAMIRDQLEAGHPDYSFKLGLPVLLEHAVSKTMGGG